MGGKKSLHVLRFNGLGMGFRAKSTDTVVKELTFLTERHNINRLPRSTIS